MSNIVGRGLGQPGEGALVAGGLTVGNGVTGDLEATCVVNGTLTCELEPGSVVPRPPGGAGQTPRHAVLDLCADMRASVTMSAHLDRTADLVGAVGAVSAVAGDVHVSAELSAIVAASAAAGASQVRQVCDDEALALLL